MPGGTLAERVAADGPPSSVAQARRLALDLLAALGAAHERGIVHRDESSPRTSSTTPRGNAKLGDFGAAHLADFGQTQTGGFFGTVAYMAPEQITGGAIGVAADLYALGVTLFVARLAARSSPSASISSRSTWARRPHLRRWGAPGSRARSTRCSRAPG